jgi:hypothetical protein
LCEGKTAGVAVALGPGGTDMGTFEAVNPATQKNAIFGGFSVDESNSLHWKNENDQFTNLMGWKHVTADPKTFPNQEPQFAIFKSFLTGDIPKFFINLGCTDPKHLSGHGDLHMGPVKAIAL